MTALIAPRSITLRSSRSGDVPLRRPCVNETIFHLHKTLVNQDSTSAEAMAAKRSLLAILDESERSTVMPIALHPEPERESSFSPKDAVGAFTPEVYPHFSAPMLFPHRARINSSRSFCVRSPGLTRATVASRATRFSRASHPKRPRSPRTLSISPLCV